MVLLLGEEDTPTLKQLDTLEYRDHPDVIRRFGWGSILSNYRGYLQTPYADVNVFNYNYFDKYSLTLLWIWLDSAIENSNIALFILRGMVIMSPPL